MLQEPVKRQQLERNLDQIYLLILESPAERQESPEILSKDRDSGSNHFRLLVLPRTLVMISTGLPRGYSGKESTCQYRRCRRHRFDPWFGKIPQRRK